MDEKLIYWLDKIFFNPILEIKDKFWKKMCLLKTSISKLELPFHYKTQQVRSFLNQQHMIQSKITLHSTSNSQKQRKRVADLSLCSGVWPSPWSSKWNPGSCRPAPFPWSTGRKAAPALFDKSHPLFLQALPTSILLTCRPLRLMVHYPGPLGSCNQRGDYTLT